MKWQSPGWQPATKTASAPSKIDLITKAGSTLLEQGTWTSFTSSGYFILRLPAISDALNVQKEQAKPIICGLFPAWFSMNYPLSAIIGHLHAGTRRPLREQAHRGTSACGS